MKTSQDVFYAVLKRWWRLTVPWRLRRRGVYANQGAIFYGMPIVSTVAGSTIFIGERTVLASHSFFTALGVSRPCILRTTRAGARIAIGADTGISGVTICAATSVTIGKDCLIGADVMIVDNDFHPIDPMGRRYSKDHKRIQSSPVTVGDNVFVGTRSVVLKGVTIGDNSVIGAGSVVVSDVPANSIAVGSPARVVRRI